MLMDRKRIRQVLLWMKQPPIEVRGNTLKYVSRGGLKLEKAMTHFGVELKGKICMDVGASTGGFTDCIFCQNGAVKVYSVDVRPWTACVETAQMMSVLSVWKRLISVM